MHNNKGNGFKRRVINMAIKNPDMTSLQIACKLNVHVGQISQIICNIGFERFNNDMVEEIRYENGIRIEKIKAAHAYGSEAAYNRVYR